MPAGQHDIQAKFFEQKFEQAVALHKQGRFGEAEQLYRQLLDQQPDNASAGHMLGVLALDAGFPEHAVPILERARKLDRRNSAVHNNLASSYLRLGRVVDALASYETAIKLTPGNADFRYNKAGVLKDLRRYEEAIAAYDEAIELRPNFARAHHNRGCVLAEFAILERAMQQLDTEELPAEKAATQKQDLIQAQQERHREAISAFERAIAADPELKDAYLSRLAVLSEMGMTAEAESYARQLAADPRLRGDANYILAQLLLRQGRWEEGWRLNEARWDFSQTSARRSFSQPLWLGSESLAGKTLFVHAEQALGDNIQFSRYLSCAADLGARVVFEAPVNLVRLLKSLDARVTVLPAGSCLPQFDFHAPLQSMPLAFRTVVETIPGKMPYLKPEDTLVAKWRERIGQAGFKIGFFWKGNPVGGFYLERSFPLQYAKKLAQIPGVRLISLKKGDEPHDPAEAALESLGPDFDSGSDAFVDTIAAMQSLDLVISCDTSVAHLAGAAGRPVWVALTHNPEWRWMQDRTDSPWYSTMKLFRQKTPADWESVFHAMHACLLAEYIKSPN